MLAAKIYGYGHIGEVIYVESGYEERDQCNRQSNTGIPNVLLNLTMGNPEKSNSRSRILDPVYFVK